MAKLSREILDEGRTLLLAAPDQGNDLDGLMSWVARHAPLVNVDLVRSTLDRCLQAGDTARALKMFDAAFVDYDEATYRLESKVRSGCLFVFALIALGSLGGVVYLFQSCSTW